MFHRLQVQGGINLIEFGSVPDWIAAVGTTVALVIAAETYRRDVKHRRESQARLVYAKTTIMRTIASGELIAYEKPVAMLIKVPAVLRRDADGTTAHVSGVPALRVRAIIHNGSDELASKVHVQLVRSATRTPLVGGDATLNPIDPGTDYEQDLVIENPWHPGMPSVSIVLTFRDSQGSWWRRCADDPVEAIEPPNQDESPATDGVWTPVGQ